MRECDLSSLLTLRVGVEETATVTELDPSRLPLCVEGTPCQNAACL